MKARAAATPVGLILLAGGAAAYAYFDRGAVSDADRAARKQEVFPSFRVEEVTGIELGHGAESLVLERPGGGPAGGTWTITSPRRERADPAAVDVLLRDLDRATRLRDVDARDAVGLDAPRARGRVRVGTLEYRFVLGADAPVPEGAAYMRVEGEGTFVVDRALKVQLLRGADAYRDRSLLPWGASAIERLEVRSASGAFALERHGASFRLAARGLRAGRAAVDEMMTALADARAEAFVDDAVAAGAIATPDLTVTIAPRDAAAGRVAFRVGGACPDHPEDLLIVRDEPSPLSACVARRTIDALRADASRFVDRSPLYAHADEIEELRIEPVGRDGPRVDVARRGAGWHERAPDDREIPSEESDPVNALAAALAAASGTDVRLPASDERLDARSRVTVVRTGGATTEVVEIGAAAPDGSVLVRRADDGAVLRLARDAARRFEPRPVALRAPRPWPSPFDAASVVAIDDGCGPTAQRLELVDRTWVLRSPADAAADPVSVADLAGALAHARAEAWISEADDGGFGFGAPGACTVTLALDAGSSDAAPRRLSLSFGSAVDGGFYARTGVGGAVFVAPAALRRALEHPAIDRSRFRLDLAPDATVTLLRGDVRRTLGADAGDDRLAGAVAGLHAQCALHAGPPERDEGLDRPTLDIRAVSRTDARAPVETRIVVGAETRVDDVDSYFARVSGVDATFAIPAPVIAAILAAM